MENTSLMGALRAPLNAVVGAGAFVGRYAAVSASSFAKPVSETLSSLVGGFFSSFTSTKTLEFAYSISNQAKNFLAPDSHDFFSDGLKTPYAKHGLYYAGMTIWGICTIANMMLEKKLSPTIEQYQNELDEHQLSTCTSSLKQKFENISDQDASTYCTNKLLPNIHTDNLDSSNESSGIFGAILGSISFLLSVILFTTIAGGLTMGALASILIYVVHKGDEEGKLGTLMNATSDTISYIRTHDEQYRVKAVGEVSKFFQEIDPDSEA